MKLKLEYDLWLFEIILLISGQNDMSNSRIDVSSGGKWSLNHELEKVGSCIDPAHD
jgi:hypothetical protein